MLVKLNFPIRQRRVKKKIGGVLVRQNNRVFKSAVAVLGGLSLFSSLVDSKLLMGINAELAPISNRGGVRSRCLATGRTRGNVSNFGLSRLSFKKLSEAGFLPGVRRSSW